ncbi:putative sulfate exporter family transporter [Alicyclobacillus sp.]|uniref:YeiH family protein n=1 Tax=Alicyclobacillus sp. TaxID=61169 RepID=UPI0025C18F51|nr:putative sulfate exporter family transporter [Alicyclobacillus sp.]MCL6517181.1 putative sulfate exporter family transporter [Alicyclobacillus sp.]
MRVWLGRRGNRFALGIAFTLAIAALGTGLARLPGFDRVGPLACAIAIAVVYRQLAGYPEALRPGIQFSAKRLLRFAIVLYGLRLNIAVILHDGLGLVVRDAATIAFSIGLMVLLARWWRADASLSLLLGVGTGVCGASAIAAVSPIVGAKEEDTAIAAGIIALGGTVFAIAYTLLRPLLPLPALQYGVWSGVSIHEVAQVALAAAPAGGQALAVALLAKLGRVFLLIPLAFGMMLWMKRRGRHDGPVKVEFPWFLVGFLAMSLAGSYLVPVLRVPSDWMQAVSNFSSFLLTAAMVGLGLNVSLKDVRTKAVRPFVAMVATSVLLSGWTLLSLWW